ncbi:hypothetical protein G6O69_07025 [Pseudenhygromyxa sp. WMMC2535]|uniref:hypothetical protein n=1 Tax=Pseudenhygromyxa sp. WMMC2535 TaxID=2712867 RepID=UPI0015567AED|nr:hypothetical protein [Pseudenhygromyxa sp. WMMC2535]NVB37579.1 hypothetical protein [Pseudenhygromyxa sp. WMMC2535]
MLPRSRSRRRKALLVGAASLVGAGVGCAQRQLEQDPSFADIHREPVCMVLVGTHGYWEDGTIDTINDDENGGSLSACMCMSEEEYEKGERDEALADLMLEVCLGYSSYRGYDWDDCEEDRYDGEWMYFINWWDDPDFDWAYDGTSCEPPEASECSVGESRGRAPMLGLGIVLILVGLRQRRFV